MNINIRLRNDKAINAIKQGDLYNAQQLLRKNVKSKKCVMTLNNIGVFYAEYNILSENLRERDGRKAALHYLEKAVEGDSSGKTAFSMGKIFFELENYSQSALYFEKSFLLGGKFSAIYNKGMSQFMQRKYQEALSSFETSAPLARGTQLIDVALATAYTQVYCKKDSALESAQEVFRIDDKFFNWDKFVLAYLLGDKERMTEYIDTVIKGFALDRITRAMAIDTLLISNRKNDADTFYTQELECLKESCYNNSLEIRELKRLYNDSDFRKKLIGEFLPPIELSYMDCFMI